MASLAITFQSVCAGGCHLNVGASIDAGPTLNLRIDSNELLTPLTVTEAPDIVLNILRIKLRGLTRAQARTAIQANPVITV